MNDAKARGIVVAAILIPMLVGGCATLSVGDKYAAKTVDSNKLKLCVFGGDDSVSTRNTIAIVLSGATSEYFQRPSYFQEATYVRSLNETSGCDVAMKIDGRTFLYSTRPVELYSAYSKKLLVKYEAHIGGGTSDAVVMADQHLKSGGPLYEQILSEAGPARRPRPVLAAAPSSPGMSNGLSKEEIRQMMAEAVQSAGKTTAAAAPSAPTSDVDTPRYRSGEDPRGYAVVIGVEKYNGLPDATFAERDAKAVYGHLIALGYPLRNVALLVGAQATRTGLVKNIEAWLPQNVDEKSSVFIYYSGHGAPDPTGGAAYLVPSDGDPQYLEETAYPVKRLYEKLQALKAKRVIVAMDSCFSGSGGRSVLAKGTRPLVGKIDLGATTGKVVSLTASASNQISGVIEEQGHGAFTYYLLRGLNGEAKNSASAVTVKSLYDYLSPRVQDAAKRANRDQTPQLMAIPGQDDVVFR